MDCHRDFDASFNGICDHILHNPDLENCVRVVTENEFTRKKV